MIVECGLLHEEWASVESIWTVFWGTVKVGHDRLVIYLAWEHDKNWCI